MAKPFADKAYEGFIAKDLIGNYVNPYKGLIRYLRKEIQAGTHCPKDSPSLEIMIERYLEAKSAKALLSMKYTFERDPVRGVTLGDWVRLYESFRTHANAYFSKALRCNNHRIGLIPAA